MPKGKNCTHGPSLNTAPYTSMPANNGKDYTIAPYTSKENEKVVYTL